MLTAVTSGLSTVIGWVGTVITSLVDSTDGELYELLPLLAIGVSISVLMLGFKIIRKCIWGA